MQAMEITSPGHHHIRVVTRGAGDGQHVVERHRDVGDGDLHNRLPERLGLRRGMVSSRVLAVTQTQASITPPTNTSPGTSSR